MLEKSLALVNPIRMTLSLMHGVSLTLLEISHVSIMMGLLLVVSPLSSHDVREVWR